MNQQHNTINRWNATAAVFNASLGIMLGAFGLAQQVETNQSVAIAGTATAEHTSNTGDALLLSAAIELGGAAISGMCFAAGRTGRREEEPVADNPAVFVIQP